MTFTHRALSPEELAGEIARLLPEYVPGIETGIAEYTDKRSCWTKTLRAIFEVIARSRGIAINEQNTDDFVSDRQVKAFWHDGDALLLAALSGWGERADLERNFGRLMLLKSPQKVIVYTCIKWQEAVLDQLTAALMRYPHHIEGEQYIAINLLAAQGKVFAMVCDVPHSGHLDLEEATFRPVHGSPFVWRLVEHERQR